jgi:small subunit ribosomal protein S20
MNKKQKNRKLVKQNKRNRMINRRYSSTIKSLSKLFISKVKGSNNTVEEEEKSKVKLETLNIVNKVYSIIDKAVKKGVIHKNTAARKKSKIGKMLIKM